MGDRSLQPVELSNLSRRSTDGRQLGAGTTTPSIHSNYNDGGGQVTPALSDTPIVTRIDENSIPPDGGYGWVVVACCSVAVFFFSGSSYSYGVIQAKLEQDGVGSSSTLAFVGSMSSAALSIFAIPNAALIRRFGARKVLMAGGVITGLGEIIAGWAVHSIPGLFISFGVVTGVGYSMIYMPCSVLPAQYFVRRRGLAYGLVQSAGGLGGGVIAISLNFLLETVGPAWCFRILGLATLACVVPAAIIVKERPGPKSRTAIEWRIFRDLRYTTIWLASAIATFPLLVPPFFLPMYGQAIGLSSFSSAALVSGFNLSSALGRISFGQLSDMVGPVNSLILAMLINSIGLLLIWPFSSDLAPLIVFVILGGLSVGAFFSLMAPTIASLIDPASMTSSFGLLVTGWGAGYLFGPPIAGYLLQVYGGPENGLKAYRPAMFYAGGITLFAAVMVIAMRWRSAKSWKKKM